MNHHELTILSALAEIQDIQVFRLRDFMSKLGLDSKQPSIFYRELLKESRDAIRMIDDLQNRLDTVDKAKSQMDTKMSAQQRHIVDLEAKLPRLQNETKRRIAELESTNSQLKTTTSELLDMAENYEAMKNLLKGIMRTDGLRALCDLLCAIYQKSIVSGIAGKRELEETDLKRLAPIVQRLREELIVVLQIPRRELEERLIKAEKTNEAFKSLITQIYDGKR